MAGTPQSLLREWIARRCPPGARQWLDERLASLERSSDRDLDITLGLIPRRLGKADLNLAEDELADAAAAREGWDPRLWSVDETARILVLSSLPAEGFAERFAALCRTAEVAESVALYRGLPLYPGQAALEPQAGEGLRTNMRSVFEAVAHRSPFPRERFAQERWNHMVLKALFVNSRLDPIQGLDARANAELAHILSDYAHERWAAGRPVSPELWRCVGPFATGDLVGDLVRAADGRPAERAAAALAMAASHDPAAAEALARLPDEAAAIRAGRLTWTSLADAREREEAS